MSNYSSRNNNLNQSHQEICERSILSLFIVLIMQTPPTFGFVVDRIEREPEVKQRMIAEIDAHFAEDPDRPITYNDLSELVYCDAVVNEGTNISYSNIPLCYV